MLGVSSEPPHPSPSMKLASRLLCPNIVLAPPLAFQLAGGQDCGVTDLAMKLLDGSLSRGPICIGDKGATLSPEELYVSDVSTPPKNLAEVLLRHIFIHIPNEGSGVVGVQITGVELACNASTPDTFTLRFA